MEESPTSSKLWDLNERYEPTSKEVKRLPSELMWIPHFFHARYVEISKLFYSRGCREKWIHGEIFLDRNVVNDNKIIIDKNYTFIDNSEGTKGLDYDVVQNGKDGYIIEIKVVEAGYKSPLLHLRNDCTKLANFNERHIADINNLVEIKGKGIPYKTIENSSVEIPKYLLCILGSANCWDERIKEPEGRPDSFYYSDAYKKLVKFSPSENISDSEKCKYQYSPIGSESVFNFEYGDFTVMLWKIVDSTN